jgi:hypothetical protein
MNILLLGFAFALPYHVMRCAGAAGHSVAVLGNGPAHALLRSPSCADFYLSDFDYHAPDYRILTQEIAHLAIAIGFDLVMPSDAVSTRALAAIKDEIPLPAATLTSVGIFDTLSHRARFAALCVHHGIPFGDHVEIPGETLGISVLCERGKIVAHLIEERTQRHFRVRSNPNLVATTARLIEAISFDGIAHFAAVTDRATDLCHLTGCQPWFPPSVAPAMVAGINFVEAAIDLSQGVLPPQSPLAPTTIKLYPAALRALPTPWRLSRRDWRLLAYHLREYALFAAERRSQADHSDVLLPATGNDAASLSPRETLAS